MGPKQASLSLELQEQMNSECCIDKSHEYNGYGNKISI